MLLMKWSRANVPEPTDKFCESRMDKRWEIQHGSLDDDWWGCRWTLMHSARFICYSTTGSTASVPKGLSKGQSMGSNVAIIAVMFFCWHLRQYLLLYIHNITKALNFILQKCLYYALNNLKLFDFIWKIMYSGTLLRFTTDCPWKLGQLGEHNIWENMKYINKIQICLGNKLVSLLLIC